MSDALSRDYPGGLDAEPVSWSHQKPSETECLALKSGLKCRCLSLKDAMVLGQRQAWSERQRSLRLAHWAELHLSGCTIAMDEGLFAALVARWPSDAFRLKQAMRR
ncbi:hypothetical protein [Coralliovum pocilloporae]|uniref:hypothetical protein n=1 Tax=Coralliovum pocilloporae TaxID=3066369 RepID=UPI003307C0F7